MSMFLVLIALLLLPLHTAGQDVATVTLLEGSLHVIRGTTVLTGSTGVRLLQGDILESSEKSLVQVEFARGPIVALGPSTRLYLFKAVPAAGELMLLSGWLKGEGGAAAGAYSYATPLLAATTQNGTVVFHTGPQSTELFVESGPATVGAATSDGSRGHGGNAKTGQYFSRQAGGEATMKMRPDMAFVSAMPVPFRDTLLSRSARFGDKAVAAKFDHEVNYPEIQAWLNIGRTWRRGFVQRFQPRLRDSAFRKPLEAELAAHPEWDPVLHPEKYRPKSDAPLAQKPDQP
jgi:hypothetical protein